MFAAKAQKEARDFSLTVQEGAEILELRIWGSCLGGVHMLLVLQGANWKETGTEDRLPSSLWGPETLQSEEGAESRVRQYGVMVRGCVVVRLSHESLSVLTCQLAVP